MELCKENLMRYIFRNRENIPGVSSIPSTAERNVIRWAKDIANALNFIHKQGIVHRDLKLENILVSRTNSEMYNSGEHGPGVLPYKSDGGDSSKF